MRISGTTKSYVANHVAETVAGAVTIRAFEEEDRFFEKNLDLIDINASAFFHNFASNEWLILRLETISASLLATTALCMVMLPPGTFTSGENSVNLISEMSLFQYYNYILIICFYPKKKSSTLVMQITKFKFPTFQDLSAWLCLMVLH